MSAPPPKSEKKSSSAGNFTTVFVLVVLLAAAFYLFVQKNVDDGNGGSLLRTGPSRGGLAVGSVAPKIDVAGWVDDKTPGDLSGKVVVIDAWATWCLPCREEAPHLVETWKKFADRDDVVFIGMTVEDESSLPAIKAFMKEFGITWPNAYGAKNTLTAFHAEYIPSVWVINRQGKVAWNFDSRQELTDAILEALDN